MLFQELWTTVDFLWKDLKHAPKYFGQRLHNLLQHNCQGHVTAINEEIEDLSAFLVTMIASGSKNIEFCYEPIEFFCKVFIKKLNDKLFKKYFFRCDHIT